MFAATAVVNLRTEAEVHRLELQYGVLQLFVREHPEAVTKPFAEKL